jgi:hypothetical protein
MDKYITDIIETYFNNDLREQILTYYRIFFIYYVWNVFVNKIEKPKEEHRMILISSLDKSLGEIKKNNKIIIDISIIKNNINKYFDELYKTFFEDKNIYFHTYFNNVIKYFLPLPFEYIDYCSFLVYRKHVDNIYKKNNNDYLQKFKSNDDNENSNNYKYNVDINRNEIDIHIPIDKFDMLIFNDDNYLFLCHDDQYTYICNKNEILMRRELKKFRNDHYKNSISLNMLLGEWETYNKHNVKEILDNTSYLCVLKKIGKEDIVNVFRKINFKKGEYVKLYHNTSLNKEIDEYNKMLDKASFFYLTPLGEAKMYMINRRCIEYTIVNDINELIDLTQPITSANGFMEYLLKDKKFIGIDTSNINIFFDTSIKKIPKREHENNKCLVNDDNDIDPEKYRSERIYCDNGLSKFYSGRRKLQELVFKTRKYSHADLYHQEWHRNTYTKFGYKLIKNEIPSYDFDTQFISKIGINGFFFTDYFDAIRTGGEIFLSNPKKYVNFERIGNYQCNDINTFNNKHIIPIIDKKFRDHLLRNVNSVTIGTKLHENNNIFNNKYMLKLNIVDKTNEKDLKQLYFNKLSKIDDSLRLLYFETDNKIYKGDEIMKNLDNIKIGTKFKYIVLFKNWIIYLNILLSNNNTEINVGNKINGNDEYLADARKLFVENKDYLLLDKYIIENYKEKIKL